MKLTMPSSIEPRKTPTSKAYFKNSWLMLKENYRAFIFTELFAIFAFLLTMVFSVGSLLVIVRVFPPHFTPFEFMTQMANRYNLSIIFRISVSFVTGIVFIGFMNSQFGLANDIINSGDMFAQFKGSFSYFKKNWFQFYILTLCMFGFAWIIPGSFSNFHDNPPAPITFSIWEIILLIINFILFFLWFIMLIHAFPSLVYKNKLFLALKESFLIFKKDFQRITKTWGIFFIIFTVPSLLAVIFGIIVHPPSVIGNIMPVFAFIFVLVMLFLGFPFTTLLATGIYNNSSIFTANSIIQNPQDNSKDSPSNSKDSLSNSDHSPTE
ncbi:MAG: hypothetical protein ACTSYI_15165 [Promethearchaeota archaeon]